MHKTRHIGVGELWKLRVRTLTDQLPESCPQDCETSPVGVHQIQDVLPTVADTGQAQQEAGDTSHEGDLHLKSDRGKKEHRLTGVQITFLVTVYDVRTCYYIWIFHFLSSPSLVFTRPYSTYFCLSVFCFLFWAPIQSYEQPAYTCLPTHSFVKANKTKVLGSLVSS